MYHISWSSNGDPFSHARVYSEQLRLVLRRRGAPGAHRCRSATTTDPAEREQVVADMQAHMWDQMWHVPLYNSDFTIAHARRASGPRRAPELPDRLLSRERDRVGRDARRHHPSRAAAAGCLA